MATHRIYFAHGGEQRTQPPPLELKLYEVGDDPDEIERAGRAYGRWLILNASGTWTRGLRRALAENPVMNDDHNTTQEEQDNEPGE